MLKLITYSVSFFLISIIFLRLPQESTGLQSAATKTNLLGSPSLARQILNFLTAFAVLIYFGIAVKLNISSS